MPGSLAFRRCCRMTQHPPDRSDPAHPHGRIVVLLVDDQALVGTFVRHLLASEPDIELHCCLRADEVMAAADRHRPAVIFQDLVMPDADGFELIQRLRASPTTARTPIVVLSANDDAETRARARAEGADDYLVKLPGKRELIDLIRRMAAVAGRPGPG